MSRISKLKSFFGETLWQEDLRLASKRKFLGYGSLRVAIHTVFGFQRNLGDITAAGLTMYTLLALVPLLALVIWVAQMLGFDEMLRQGIVDAVLALFPTLEDVVDQVKGAVRRVNFGALGIIGTVILMYTGYALFYRVEQVMNQIWRTTRSRVWWRSITGFFALVVVLPLLAICAIVLNSFLHHEDWVGWLRSHVSWLAEAYGFTLMLVPHVMLWLAFFGLYKIMPAVRVGNRGALVGSVLAGSAWMGLHELYLYFQVGVALWQPIYAGFLALPLLLIYLQLTWTTILVGGEISYGVQHIHDLRAPWGEGDHGGAGSSEALGTETDVPKEDTVQHPSG